LASVESVKAASEIYMPISGVVTEVNTALNDQSELINADPFGTGWLSKVRVTGDTDNPALLDADAYAAWCNTR
jgi:glycine cleavage system H protein